MLSKTMLDLLDCPKCKGDLTYRPEEGNDTSGSLTCLHCQLTFVVDDDIPNMVIDQAQRLDQPEAKPAQDVPSGSGEEGEK